MAFHTMQRAPERVAGVGLSVHYAVLDSTDRVAQCAGFSLHAGVAAEDSQRDKLERLCRYISRPAVAIERLSRLPGRAHPLHPEDPVPRRHDARAVRTALPRAVTPRRARAPGKLPTSRPIPAFLSCRRWTDQGRRTQWTSRSTGSRPSASTPIGIWRYHPRTIPGDRWFMFPIRNASRLRAPRIFVGTTRRGRPGCRSPRSASLDPQRRMHPTGDWRLWLPPPSEGRLDRHPVRDIAGRREKARCPRRRR